MLLGLVGYAVWPKPAVQAPGQFGPPGAGGGGGGFRGPGGGAGRGGGAPTSVNTAKVSTADVPVYLNALGTVTPTATVVVRSQVSGQLTEVGFREGQLVSKGQFLAQIDPRPFQQVLNQAEAALARDQASVQNARVTLERFQTLLAQDSIARQQVDDQQAQVRTLEATLRGDQATIGSARLNLTYARVVSPVTGRVGLRRVDVGNYVSTGDANGIVVVTEVAPIDVLFTAPEDQLPQLNKRIKAAGAMKAEAFDRSQSTKLADGQFLTLDNQVDTTTGTVKVKARFSNADGGLFPNQFVNIRLLVDTIRGALTVPSSAVQRGADGMFVYVVQPDRTVTVRAITPGVVSGTQTVVGSGLQLGETVVIDGADRLREGARVLLPGDCPPAFGQGGAGGQGGQRRRAAGQGGAPGGAPAAAAAQAPKSGGLFGNLFGKKDQAGQAGQRRGAGVAGCTPAPAAAAAGGQGFGGGFGSPGGQGQAPGGQPQAGQGFPAASAPAGATGAVDAPRAQGGPVQGGPAQGGFGGQGQGAGPGGGILAQLDLDPAQMQKAQATLAAARERAAASPGDPDARRQALRKAFADIEPILRPDQKEKLKTLQAQGGGFGGGRGPQGPN